ncbi:hypothetical protein ABIB35_000919 [Arthrobacter sp. UYP6]
MCSILSFCARQTKVLGYWTFPGNYLFSTLLRLSGRQIFCAHPESGRFPHKRGAVDQAITESRLSETGRLPRVLFPE